MKDSRLLIAALTALTPHIDLLGEYEKAAYTVGQPKRYKHPIEIDDEKREAKRREIAEWNAKVEAKRK